MPGCRGEAAPSTCDGSPESCCRRGTGGATIYAAAVFALPNLKIMIKRATPVLGILALLVAAPAAAQEDRAVANLLVAGDFEADAISLRLPSVSPFPLVAGGWGVRSDETGATASIPAAVIASKLGVRV